MARMRMRMLSRTIWSGHGHILDHIVGAAIGAEACGGRAGFRLGGVTAEDEVILAPDHLPAADRRGWCVALVIL
ncbi:MAG TPA: hypothetical protein VNR51_06510 [Hyphomicrobium sp.]|nr:hypothetical protein [Hyphomicrobium sp.]